MISIKEGRFKAREEGDGKRMIVYGPFEALMLEVDHDDVDHATTHKELRQMLRILEEHWPQRT